MGRSGLWSAITRNGGGTDRFRELLGYTTSLHQKYMSDLMSYSGRRGKGTEKLVKVILQDWCNQNGYPEPEYNKKLAAKNVIEFVCNTGRRIGVDVINTKTRYGDSIRNKYRHKDYSKHLDKLWIVVFSR